MRAARKRRREEDEMITELFADVIYEPNQNGNAYVAHVDEEDEESQSGGSDRQRHGIRKNRVRV